MIIRVDVPTTRGIGYFKTLLDHLKKLDTYERITNKAGTRHCADFYAITPEFFLVYMLAGTLKKAYFYVDGIEKSAHDIFLLIKEERPDNMLQGPYKLVIDMDYEKGPVRSYIYPAKTGDELLQEIKEQGKHK